MKEFFRSVELKLARALEQAQRLSLEISEWTSSSPMSFECNLRAGRLGCCIVMGEFKTQPALDKWSLDFGECVHNLRSALDNLAFALARLNTDPPQHPARISFPICSTHANFENGGRRAINQLGAETAALIEKMQPFQRRNTLGNGSPEKDLLALLQWFSNIDKHQVPKLVLITPRTMENTIQLEFYSEIDAIKNTPPNPVVYVGALSPGVVLVEFITGHPIQSIRGQLNMTAVVSLENTNGSMGAGETISSLYVYTETIIAEYRRFFE